METIDNQSFVLSSSTLSSSSSPHHSSFRHQYEDGKQDQGQEMKEITEERKEKKTEDHDDDDDDGDDDDDIDVDGDNGKKLEKGIGEEDNPLASSKLFNVVGCLSCSC